MSCFIQADCRLQIKTKSVQSGKADIDENYRETLPEVTEDVVIEVLGGHNNEDCCR